MKIIQINGEEFTSRDILHNILRSKLVELEHLGEYAEKLLKTFSIAE